ncbi:MAG: hypothetical protein R2764_15700 [Bacteroidales bacterium]
MIIYKNTKRQSWYQPENGLSSTKNAISRYGQSMISLSIGVISPFKEPEETHIHATYHSKDCVKDKVDYIVFRELGKTEVDNKAKYYTNKIENLSFTYI